MHLRAVFLLFFLLGVRSKPLLSHARNVASKSCCKERATNSACKGGCANVQSWVNLLSVCWKRNLSISPCGCCEVRLSGRVQGRQNNKQKDTVSWRRFLKSLLPSDTKQHAFSNRPLKRSSAFTARYRAKRPKNRKINRHKRSYTTTTPTNPNQNETPLSAERTPPPPPEQGSPKTGVILFISVGGIAVLATMAGFFAVYRMRLKRSEERFRGTDRVVYRSKASVEKTRMQGAGKRGDDGSVILSVPTYAQTARAKRLQKREG